MILAVKLNTSITYIAYTIYQHISQETLTITNIDPNEVLLILEQQDCILLFHFFLHCCSLQVILGHYSFWCCEHNLPGILFLVFPAGSCTQFQLTGVLLPSLRSWTPHILSGDWGSLSQSFLLDLHTHSLRSWTPHTLSGDWPCPWLCCAQTGPASDSLPICSHLKGHL